MQQVFITCLREPKKYPTKTSGNEIPIHMQSSATIVANGTYKQVVVVVAAVVVVVVVAAAAAAAAAVVVA